MEILVLSLKFDVKQLSVVIVFAIKNVRTNRPNIKKILAEFDNFTILLICRILHAVASYIEIQH